MIAVKHVLHMGVDDADFYTRTLVGFRLVCGHLAERLIPNATPIGKLPRKMKCHDCERLKERDGNNEES